MMVLIFLSAIPLWWCTPTPANLIICANVDRFLVNSAEVKNLGVVGQVFLRYDSVLAAGELKLFFRFQRLVRVEIDLQFDVNEAGCMINEDATACEHVLQLGLPP
jgi:hypothetical protein